jgi:hypothetical protein
MLRLHVFRPLRSVADVHLVRVPHGHAERRVIATWSTGRVARPPSVTQESSASSRDLPLQRLLLQLRIHSDHRGPMLAAELRERAGCRQAARISSDSDDPWSGAIEVRIPVGDVDSPGPHGSDVIARYRTLEPGTEPTGSQPSRYQSCGFHACSCCAISDHVNHVLPDGTLTNSLCVHYLAYHRHECPRPNLDTLGSSRRTECSPRAMNFMARNHPVVGRGRSIVFGGGTGGGSGRDGRKGRVARLSHTPACRRPAPQTSFTLGLPVRPTVQ